MKHRKVYEVPGDAHELTFSTHSKRPLLNEEANHLLAKSINRAKEVHDFSVWAYAFMPDHVHLLIWPRKAPYSIARILTSIKQPVAREMSKIIHATDPPLAEELTVTRKSGRSTFRFWAQGGGYDRNLSSHEYIRNRIDYIHNNPAKANLASVDQYKWSSWCEYEGTGQGLVEVDLWTPNL